MRMPWARSVFSGKSFRSALGLFGECFYLLGVPALGLVPGPDKQPFLWRLYYLETLPFASSALSTRKSCSGFGSDSRELWRPREARAMAMTKRREQRATTVLAETVKSHPTALPRWLLCRLLSCFLGISSSSESHAGRYS